MNASSNSETNYPHLNNDLARNILIYLDKHSNTSMRNDSRFIKFSDEEIVSQVRILELEKYITVAKGDVDNIEALPLISSLTDNGFQFLNLVRNENTWLKIKNKTNGRELSFREIESIARELNLNTKDEVTIIAKHNAPKTESSRKSIKQTESPIKSKPKPKSNNPKTKIANASEKVSADELVSETISKVTEVATKVTTDSTTQSVIDEYLPTVQMSNVGDQPTDEDKLGFKPYVEAIANFLTDEKTKGPFTLSIEGEWGSGKSSFMLQVEKELKRIEPNILTVHFNAWRYDKEDALWAAFATRVVKELSEKVSWRERWKAKYQLFRCRYDWKKGWFSFISLAVMIVLLIILAIALITTLINNPEKLMLNINWSKGLFDKENLPEYIKLLTVSVVGYGVLYILAARKINEIFINPLAADYKKHKTAPDYKQRATFLDDFHEDFNKIIEAYAGKGDAARKVFVFIDDLDRCEVPKSAELMQALNLMLSETPQLFFIIGMDREKVAAGLAVKYEKLIPYLNPAPASNAPNANPGLEYGFEFIEKFIQVPFKIPSPNADNIGKLIAELSVHSEVPTIQTKTGNDNGNDSNQSQNTTKPFRAIFNIFKRDIKKAKNEYDKDLKKAKDIYDKDIENITGVPRLPELPKQEDVDSDEIAEVIKTVAPFFDFNPRRIKQFLNIFRLKIYIGNETGLFNIPADGLTLKRINLHKLGKFVAISLRYPLLINDLDETPTLLSDLQNNALGNNTFEAEKKPYWANKTRLNNLLCANILETETIDDDGFNPYLKKFGLGESDISKLLLISPTVKTPATSEALNSQSEESALE
jgi:hypothetical protein